MALYRTVSDRGIWKKYKHSGNAQPQHFHKANYIDKSAPVVTYSQLDLGQGIRGGHRQSIPDVRRDIAESNSRIDAAQDRSFHAKRNRFTKSCPTTPGRNTPTRSLSTAKLVAVDQNTKHKVPVLDGRYRESSTDREADSACPTPSIVNGNGQYLPDEDRFSFESRSLTAFSNYSERESVINDSTVRLHHPQDPLASVYNELERINPYQSESAYKKDLEHVVQLFLQKAIFPQLSIINNNNNPPGPGLAPPLSGKQTPDNHRLPGRIENWTSPLASPSELDIASLGGSEPASALNPPVRQNPPRLSTREAIKQLRKEFLEAEPPRLNRPKVNKYLKQENRWKPPSSGGDSTTVSSTASSANINSNSPANIDSGSSPPLSGSESAMALSPDTSDMHFMSDTVKQEELPRLHHAEVVSLRKEDMGDDVDSSSSSSSSSEDDDEGSVHSRNIRVNIKPAVDVEAAADSNTDTITPKLEAPPQKHNVWGNNRQKGPPPLPAHGPPKDYSPPAQTEMISAFLRDQVDSGEDISEQKYFPDAEFSFSEVMENHQKQLLLQQQPGPANDSVLHPEGSGPKVPSLVLAHEGNGQGSDTDREQWIASAERSFQDMAYTTYKESNPTAVNGKDVKSKKKGLFAGLFKKSSKKSSNPYGDDFIHVQPKVGKDTSDSEQDDAMPDLHGDQSPRFHILPSDSRAEPERTAPLPGSHVPRQLFDNHQELEIGNQELEAPPQVRPPSPIQVITPPADRSADAFQPFESFHSTAVDETDIDQAFFERQARPLERKLSMSKPTNLDDILAEEVAPPQPAAEAPQQAIPVEEVKSTDRIVPEHERTQEIDIDAILFGDGNYDSDEEEGNDTGENSQDSYEIDTLTRYNTAFNSGVMASVRNSRESRRPTAPEADQDNEPAAKYADKIITSNGETTFSASPPSPGYLQSAFVADLAQDEDLPGLARTSSRNDVVNDSKDVDDYQKKLEQLALQEQAIMEEQKHLEDEQRRLADENQMLQERLELQEHQRMVASTVGESETNKRRKGDVAFSQKKQVFIQKFETHDIQTTKEKPKSLLNFDALKKKKKPKQYITEGYDSAYEDLTDNEGHTKEMLNRRKREVSQRRQVDQMQRHRQSPELTNKPDDGVRKVPRGFTKFLTKKPQQSEPEPATQQAVLSETPPSLQDSVEQANNSLNNSKSLVTPPKEFREMSSSSLAENIVTEIKKSAEQMGADLGSSSNNRSELESSDGSSFSRGRNNRHSVRKPKTKNGNSSGTEESNAEGGDAGQDNSFSRGKGRFSLKISRKANSKATESDEPSKQRGQSDVEAEEESLSRGRKRFSLRMPKSKSQMEIKAEPGDHAGGQAKRLAEKTHMQSGESRSQPQTPTEGFVPFEVKEKKQSGGFSGLFGMRSSKRSKSSDRLRHEDSSRDVIAGGRPKERPKSSSDIAKAYGQQPAYNGRRPEDKTNSMASYFGLPDVPNNADEVRQPELEAPEPGGVTGFDQGEHDLNTGPEERGMGPSATEKEASQMGSEPPVIYNAHLDQTTTQNSRKVAEEMKAILQNRLAQTPAEHADPTRDEEPRKATSDSRPPPPSGRRNVIERPHVAPPDIPSPSQMENRQRRSEELTDDAFGHMSRPHSSVSHSVSDFTLSDRLTSQQEEFRPPNNDINQLATVQRGRQTGRQSGRFRRGGSNVNSSFASVANTSFGSTYQQHDGRGLEPGGPAVARQADPAALSRTDSYRRSRPEALKAARSEESVRDTVRGKKSKKKPGECSVM